ncbi:glucosaminidase domain-containing protein [Cohnella hashimotonis]|uniref:Glucosaminidase domain-containing protein n=1 Tax=Cohnella hashimotonis TaxID=2826895 RepID=A0ABT6TH44_9BACL|nr:glucosaminidase domain-containing protein [Cohnella hashimotonis]MDI4646040.1 glucosaminidase domain-containing protein [Cohnella hashimotonis]
MRGDKKRFPLVVLIVATLFATLGLTSLAALQDPVTPAVAAPIAKPSPSHLAVPSQATIHMSYLDGPAAVNPNELPADNRKQPLKFTLDEELGKSGAGTIAGNGEKPGDNVTKPPKESSVSIYEVTAYYLNVRANPYNGSKVLRVVERGTRLAVAATTDKGWLRLKDGGYVHGGYASLIDPDAPVGAAAVDKPQDAPAKLSPALAAEQEPQAGPSGADAADRNIAGQASSDPSSPTNRVRSDSGLTEEHIAKLFEGTALAGKGIEDVVLEIEDEYGINALFTIAVMKLESGNGKSKLSRTKNNLFGLNATSGDPGNKAFRFKTKADSVRKFGQLLSDKYVEKGLTTIDKVAAKYCPASSSWAGKVMGIMKSDYRKL